MTVVSESDFLRFSSPGRPLPSVRKQPSDAEAWTFSGGDGGGREDADLSCSPLCVSVPLGHDRGGPATNFSYLFHLYEILLSPPRPSSVAVLFTSHGRAEVIYETNPVKEHGTNGRNFCLILKNFPSFSD